MNINKKNIFLLGLGVLILIVIVGCNNTSNNSEVMFKEEVTQNFKGYTGIGYDPIYHINKN